VTCPTCGAKSRVQFTMGGVQMRECHNGHQFEYDKWMADRSIWTPLAQTKKKGWF
jgi:sarcosine oxidase delta subunit